jgi:hypothetical protein
MTKQALLVLDRSRAAESGGRSPALHAFKLQRAAASHFTPERNVCGLFVESYFINDEPRLALLVVCLRWALLMGHASWPKNDSRPAPPPWRRWLDQPIALEKAEGLAWRVQ